MERQVSIVYEGIDSFTPLNEKLSAKYTKSFAYYTVKDRLPVILTKVINDLVMSKGKILAEFGQAAEEDLKSVIGKVSKLKNELVTNKSFIKLYSNGDDIKKWNEYLDSQSQLESDTPCWYYSNWMFAECYMYRRLWEAFENSATLQNVDPFARQKEDAFAVAVSDIKTIGNATLQAVSQLESSKGVSKDMFTEFLKFCLWSNRCDLSLTNGAQMSDENSSNLHFVEALDQFLLADDSPGVFDLLSEKPNGVIDFVNDNSSYEVFSDFCFCDILCTSSLASKIRFHVKKIPWFVSDVTEKDINWLLNKLEKIGMEKLSERWRKYFQSGTWTLSKESYWTLPFDYSDMKERDEELYRSLGESNLVIFKGDLNYRKLLGDINWDHCEKFETALRDFKPTNVLSLRTVKADLICGLTPGKSELLIEKDENWMRTGEYAVIQFYRHN